MRNRPHVVVAECPACEPYELYEDFQVFIPVEVYPSDRSVVNPPLERWECTSCRTTLRESDLGNIVALVPKD